MCGYLVFGWILSVNKFFLLLSAAGALILLKNSVSLYKTFAVLDKKFGTHNTEILLHPMHLKMVLYNWLTYSEDDFNH